MIKNEKQYEYSQECAQRFEYSIKALEQDEELKRKDPEGWQQRVKQYEDTDYQCASFGEILEVSAVLGVNLKLLWCR